MKYADKIEIQIEKWLEPFPNLPIKWRNWLAKNAWWLVMIAVIGSIFAIIGSFAYITNYQEYYGIYSRYYSDYGHLSGWYVFTTLISSAFLIVITVINSMAIKPLKVMKQIGWKYLFLSFLVGGISQIVSILLNFSLLTFIPSLLMTAIELAISAYILFQLKANFNGVKIVSKKKK